MTRYTCCDNLRRNAVFDHPTLNGIDFLEVLDRDAPPLSPRQRTLLVHCLKAVPLLASEQVLVEAALERCRGNQTAAATALGITRRTLYSKLRRYRPQSMG